MDYVGAISVREKIVVCKNCLISHEVLFFGNSEISQEQAKIDKLKCDICQKPLNKENEKDKVQ
jgi:hypothetical protein